VKVKVKMAPNDKERSLPASLPTPSKEEDTTVETLGEMMARLKILEEVQAENKALVQELKEIREERKSEGVPEKPPVFPDDPFTHIEPAHKRTPRKAKHDMELALFQGPWEGTLKRRSITPRGNRTELIQEELDT
jgi:hypothetical protein